MSPTRQLLHHFFSGSIHVDPGENLPYLYQYLQSTLRTYYISDSDKLAYLGLAVAVIQLGLILMLELAIHLGT